MWWSRPIPYSKPPRSRWRRSGSDPGVGSAATFEVAVSEPIVTHTIRMARVRDWLGSGGRTLKEQATKSGLREMLQESN
jgi:hypothetical protein